MAIEPIAVQDGLSGSASGCVGWVGWFSQSQWRTDWAKTGPRTEASSTGLPTLARPIVSSSLSRERHSKCSAVSGLAAPLCVVQPPLCTMTGRDDDELMLNVLRCHLTY